MTNEEKDIVATKAALELVAASVLQLKEPSSAAGPAVADTGPVL